jgi:hypothetical protein
MLTEINEYLWAKGIPGTYRGRYHDWRYGFTGFKASRENNTLGAQWVAGAGPGTGRAHSPVYYYAGVGRLGARLPIGEFHPGHTFSLINSLTLEDLLNAEDPYHLAWACVTQAEQQLIAQLDLVDGVRT